ncbi:MAG TPA: MFS transporter [bacterium]|nr:MFS transporter [bacterium]
MTATRGGRPRSPVLSPLRHRNLRLFFAGQGVSLIGTWMQTVGQAWLVLTLTRSPFLLGVINALQWFPVLLLSLPAGVLVDRVPKRTLIMATQSLFLLLALTLGLLTVTGHVRYWHVALLAALLGTVNAFDVPARQSFIVEMVGGTDDLTGAIALNSSVFNGARLIGPGLAGLMIAAWGVGAAFLANAASFIAVIAALGAMRVVPTIRVAPAVGLLMGITEGMEFIRRSATVLRVLVTLAALSLFAMNFNVFVPVLAHAQLHLDASGFGFLLAAQGLGALVGSLAVAWTSGFGPRSSYLLWGAILLCAALIALSQVARPDLAGVELFFGGMGMVMFTATANSTVQLEAPAALRGRVMSAYAMVFNGLAPFGALMMGGIIGAWGLSIGLLVGGGVGAVGVFTVRGLLGRGASPVAVAG